MGAIRFDVGGYYVSVSTHGYFRVLSKSLPSAKFTDLPGELYSGSVTELGHGIHWDGENDDVVPDVEEPIVQKACREWVAAHEEQLVRAADEAAAEWERRGAESTLIYGHPFRVNDRIAITHKGKAFYTARFLGAVPERRGDGYTIHSLHDDGTVGSVLVSATTGNGIERVQ